MRCCVVAVADLAEALVCVAVFVLVAGVPLAMFLFGDREQRRVCSCPRPSPMVVYDANGYRRWCGACGGEHV